MKHRSDRLSAVRVLEGRARTDARGRLQVLLGASQVPELRFGELYVVTSDRPGDRRGDHLHRRMVEVFSVIEGRAALELRDPDTQETVRLDLDAEQPRAVLVPAGLAHCLVNRGPGRMTAVAWATAEHDPGDVEPCAAGGAD